jgi:hypothetical protein
MASGAQRTCEGTHVALHTSDAIERVWTDEGDPHAGDSATLPCTGGYPAGMEARPERVSSLPDWDAPPPSNPWPGATAAGAVWLSLGALGWFLADAAGVPAPIGTGVVIVLLALDLLTQGRRALRGARARPVAEDSSPRVENVFRGIEERLDGTGARLYVFASPDPEAFVCHAGAPTVAVSQELVDTFSRTEMEAVLAHCLLRLRSGGARRAELACHLRWLAAAAGTVVGPHEDVAAVALTRYPPALVSALERSAEAGGGRAPLYMVARHPCHAPREDRIAVLADL